MPAPTHSTATITVMAGFAWCMKDFLSKLEEPDTSAKRKYYAARLRRLGVDTSHWDRSPKRWYTDAMLAEAVAASTTVVGVLRHLSVPNTGGQHAHFARRIRAAGIDTSHFLGQGHRRGTTTPLDPQPVLVLGDRAAGRVRTPRLRKALLACGVPQTCALCGLGTAWQGGPLVLVIDHINGEFWDNRVENLRFLCPNCHSQTSTWCRKTGAAP